MKISIYLINLFTGSLIFLWLKSQKFFVHFLDIPNMCGQVELLYLIIVNLVLFSLLNIHPRITLGCSILTILLFPFTGGQFRVDGCGYFLVIEDLLQYNVSNETAFFVAFRLVPAIIYGMYLLLFIFGAVAVFRKMNSKKQ